MRTLYHSWFCPFSRKARVILAEKGIDAAMRVEKTWERRPGFLALNPAASVPILVEEDGAVISGNHALTEYLEEVFPDRPLLGATAAARAEVRRLLDWFDVKMQREVTQHVVSEKVMKRFLRMGEPNSAALRTAAHNIRIHLDYVGHLARDRTWLAGDDYSCADIAAAAHLSILDYLGAVPWDVNDDARTWYMRIKSRPAMRPLLRDHVAGLKPPAHYAQLDF